MIQYLREQFQEWIEAGFYRLIVLLGKFGLWE